MEYSAAVEEALKKIRALKKIELETRADTSRAHKFVLNRLSPADMTIVAVALAEAGQEKKHCTCKCHRHGADDGHGAQECPECERVYRRGR